MDDDRRAIRLSLTLPGGASLGAYLAGAVAALLVGVQQLRRRGRPVVVDAVGGASSGSLVALVAAHCLLEGQMCSIRTTTTGDCSTGQMDARRRH